MTPRNAAYETLMRCEKEKQFSNIAVNNGISRYRLEDRDRDLYTLLVYGVLEKKLTLDYLIEQYTEKKIGRLDKSVVTILRLSLYQIVFCDRIPDNAAVSEGVKLAARFASRTKGYVNAVLRRACREPISMPEGESSYALSVRYSINEAICETIRVQYPKRYAEILSASNQIPTLCFHVNALFGDPSEFIQKYKLAAQEVPPLPHAVKMKEKLPLSQNTFLDAGEAFVQDAASQLSALLLDPDPSMTVVDVCACPGGKSFAAANHMLSKAKKNKEEVSGSILSCDIHESKLSLVQKGASKLGYLFINTRCHDAVNTIPALKNRVSRVICDVPCSGLGVISKKPEIRYKDMTEIEALPELQLSILEASSAYLLPDGLLLYSTCTINRAENEDVVARFLNNHTDFELAPLPFLLTWKNAIQKEGMLTLLPSAISDGFFMALIRKK